MKCPLCDNKVQQGINIDTSSIVLLWRKLGVNVANIFNCSSISKHQCANCGLGFYYPPCPGDDRFYGNLASWDWYYKHPGKSEYSFTVKMVAPGMTLIDVGCGIGEFSTYLPTGVKFIGAELSSKSVEIANSLGRNVQQIDITAAPPDFSNSFDIVTCFQVLEHIVDLRIFFSALADLCKPGGTIVIAVPNNDGFVGDAVNNVLNMPPHHVLLWNKKSLHYLANQFGLGIVEYAEEPLSNVHRYWGFTVYINKFFMKVVGSTPKVVDLSITGRFFYKIAALLARPFSRIYSNLILSGHSSIIVLQKPSND
jgi:2-polyprenyl-3-methyl-5-hydroxy-6-metoxy-1,4-benzoquinol methylase